MDPNLRALPQDGSCSGTCPLMVRSAARLSLPEREFERGLGHAQDAVGGSPELPHGVGILDIDVADFLPFRCLRVRRRAGPGECGVPLPNHGRRQVSDFVRVGARVGMAGAPEPRVWGCDSDTALAAASVWRG
jgi:hypothetical protein